MTDSTSQPFNESPPHRRPRLGTVLAAAMLVFGVMSLGLTPVRTDHDVFWHLKTGYLIVERGELPRTDPFTYGSEGVAWHNHEWLAQLGMFGLHQIGDAVAQRPEMPHADHQAGMWMLVLGKALVLVAAFGVVAWTLRRAGVCAIAACGVALLAAMASRWSIHCRPPVITYLMLAVQMAVLARHWHQRHPGVAAFAALSHFALWSNLHGGWLAGLVVIGAFAAGDMGEWVVHRWRGRGRRAAFAWVSLRARALLFIAATAGTLLNPADWHLYGNVLRVMRAKGLIARIPEMMPPSFPEHAPFHLLLALGGLALIVGLMRRGVVRLGEAFALVFFAWQASSHLRHIPLFAIVAALPVGRMLQTGIAGIERGQPNRGLAAAMLGALLAVILFIPLGIGAGVLATGRHLIWEPYGPRNSRWLAGLGYEPTHYQDAACDFLLVADPPGRLWTNLNIGGFMIWRLSPEHFRVYTDSRFDVHGDERQPVEDSINGLHPRPDWEDVLVDLEINVVVLEKATPLVRLMWESPNWTAVHGWTAPGHPWRDGTMTFIRATEENAAAIARAQGLAASLGQTPQPPQDR